MFWLMDMQEAAEEEAFEGTCSLSTERIKMCRHYPLHHGHYTDGLIGTYGVQ